MDTVQMHYNVILGLSMLQSNYNSYYIAPSDCN